MPYIIGDDGGFYEIGADYLVGAAQRLPAGIPMARQLQARQAQSRGAPAGVMQAVQAKQVSDGTLVRSATPDKAYQWPLGFPATSVPAGTTANIVTNPQKTFRLERLVIPSSLAASFIVNDLKVGNSSQFLNQNPVPALMFAEDAESVLMKAETAQINSDVVLNVTNIGLADLTFYAGLLGTAITI